MKLEIEITEEEIRSAIERKIRVALADETKGYAAEDYIKTQIKAQWKVTVDNTIKELLADSDTLRKTIATELEKKIRSQLAAALREQSK